MDCGDAFGDKYGDAVNDVGALERIIDDVVDIPLLGSAIYSQWRYFNHWAYDAADILKPKNRAWFVLAFNRLANLSEEKPIIFQGTLQKLRLLSNNICYGPCPASDDEVEQRITINAKGRVWYSSYLFGDGCGSYQKGDRMSFSLKPKELGELFEAVTSIFSNGYEEAFVTDIGDWKLELTNTEGATFDFRGPLCSHFMTQDEDLSTRFRRTLGMDSIFAFDGQA